MRPARRSTHAHRRCVSAPGSSRQGLVTPSLCGPGQAAGAASRTACDPPWRAGHPGRTDPGPSTRAQERVEQLERDLAEEPSARGSLAKCSRSTDARPWSWSTCSRRWFGRPSGSARRTRASSTCSAATSTAWPSCTAGRRSTATTSSRSRSSGGPGTVVGRVGLEQSTVHIRDVLADPDYEMHEARRPGGFRTMLGVQMLVGGKCHRGHHALAEQVDLFDESDRGGDARAGKLVAVRASHDPPRRLGDLASRNSRALSRARSILSRIWSRLLAWLFGLSDISAAISPRPHLGRRARGGLRPPARRGSGPLRSRGTDAAHRRSRGHRLP